MLTLDLSHLDGFVSKEQLTAMTDEVAAAHAKLYDSSATGSDVSRMVRRVKLSNPQSKRRIVS